MNMNSIITYYYEFVYRLLRWYWGKFTKNSRLNGIILMYHHISDVKLDELDSCQHTLNQFKNSIIKYQRLGYNFVSIEKALQLVANKSTEKFAVITFDDVPIDAYYLAVPLLESMQIPYAFFITTGFIGKDGFMTEEQLKSLDLSPLCTIGSHTISHDNLRTKKNIYKELFESKKYLQDLLGHNIDYLAYPYGRPSSVSYNVCRLAAKIGYVCAFGTIDTTINDISARKLFYLPRIVSK